MHHIDTQGLPPVHEPARRTSPGVREIINKELDEMLRHGIVRPSVSEYSSPVVIVTKKDGGMRFCVDYLKLNEQTRINQKPFAMDRRCSGLLVRSPVLYDPGLS